jgi:DNA helicase-2/ATP-dependent DNA helicase PcrA
MNNEVNDKLNALLEGKNPAQQMAIRTINGPVMIVAGAGSGKTTVLINRTANILNHGVNPSNIMLVTFTNKAASEIKDRLRESVGEKADFVNVGTFHSLFIEHILKKYKEHPYFVDYGVDMERFSIIDDKDGEKLYKEAFEMLPISIRQDVEGGAYTMSDMVSQISKSKSIGMGVEDYTRTIAPKDKKFQLKQATALLWRNYKELCVDIDGFDFDDILVACNKLMQSDPKVSIELASKFKYIMIDEYQDTNGVQMSVTDSIAMNHNNICTVGDEKQSIYAFRGSDISVILGFEKRYNGVSKIDMNINYRSNHKILGFANDAVSFHRDQTKLTPGFMVNPDMLNSKEFSNLDTKFKLSSDFLRQLEVKIDAPSVKLLTFDDQVSEAINITKAIQRDIRKGLPGSHIAIVYRNKALKNEIEKQLVLQQVPYKLIGDTSFFQRAEVKDAVALLRLIFRPWDSMAGLRVLGATNFGVSGKGARDAMKSEKIPVYQYLCKKALSVRQGGEPSAVGKKATAFLKVIDSVKRLQESGCHPDTLREFLAETWDTFMRPKLMASAKKSANKEAAANMDAKVENVHQIFSQFTSAYLESGDIGKVLDDIVLRVESPPELNKESLSSVQLMTVHACKGLEFPVVYFLGNDMQTMPGRPFEELPNVEADDEERRVFYVAITRAKTKLFLTYCKTRMQHGQYITTDICPYVDEVMSVSKDLEVIHVPSTHSNKQYSKGGQYGR